VYLLLLATLVFGLQPSPAQTPSGHATHHQKAGTIVPLYTYPTDSSWMQLVDAKASHPAVNIIAVINPNSGPGSAQNADYVKGIALLQRVGIEVVGYVSTGLTAKRPEADIHADVDRYRTWYPQLTGIFLDEMTNPNGTAPPTFYTSLNDYAHQQGFDYTIGNAGTGLDVSYVTCVDTILIYEDQGEPDLSSLSGWYGLYPNTHFGLLAYGIPMDAGLVTKAFSHIGYLYLTDRKGTNPWDGLPSYFDALMAALDGSLH
jgi:hypothetical protein